MIDDGHVILMQDFKGEKMYLKKSFLFFFFSLSFGVLAFDFRSKCLSERCWLCESQVVSHCSFSFFPTQ